MHVAVDISLYPLTADYVPPIKEFIAAIQRHPGLAVECNALSTQVSGHIDQVFAALRAEIGRTYAAPERAVFVMKMLGGG